MDSAASLAATAVSMKAAAFQQQVGTAIARQQIQTQRSVLDLVASAANASPPAPAGQGRLLDIRA